jgi:hypothetical protein
VGFHAVHAVAPPTLDDLRDLAAIVMDQLQARLAAVRLSASAV